MQDKKFSALLAAGAEVTIPAWGQYMPIIDPTGPTSKVVKLDNLFKLPAGTTTRVPLDFTAGVLLTAPIEGGNEFDGAAFYQTIDTVSGRAQTPNQQIFRLAANGAAIGPAIADYFGANSALPYALSGVYEIIYYLFYTKTTAGTVTYTLTNTQAYTNLSASYQQSAVGGIAAAAAPNMAAIVNATAAASALPATGSLTTAVNHTAIIRVIAVMGTAGNIRLRVTSSAGTITPLRGSYYVARRLSAGNVGTFVA